jgi:hypothetical protein
MMLTVRLFQLTRSILIDKQTDYIEYILLTYRRMTGTAGIFSSSGLGGCSTPRPAHHLVIACVRDGGTPTQAVKKALASTPELCASSSKNLAGCVLRY